MELVQWFKTVFARWNDFSGRSRRREYWMFALASLLVVVVLSVLESMVNGSGYLVTLYSLVVLVPGIALNIRRLHDIGKSGWWFLISFVPVVGSIILLIFALMNSQPGTNQYGPNPKGE